MFFSFIYLIICSVLGFLILPKSLVFWHRLLIGSVLGITILSLTTFLLALIFPIQTAILLGILAGATISIALLARVFKHHTPSTISLKKDPFLVAIFCFWALVFGILIKQTHLLPLNNSFTGSPSTYGDLPFHLSIITNFAYGNNFPPVNPLAPSNNLSYHFLSDFLSSILLVLSNNLHFSLIIPGILLGGFSGSLLSLFVYNLTHSRPAAIFTPFLFFFNGGIGFIKVFEKIKEHGLFNAFTSIHERYAHIPEWGVDYPNILSEILMAERALLLGIPLFLIALIFIVSWQSEKKLTYILYAALATGLLPYANVYGYLVLGIACATLFSCNLIKGQRKAVYSWIIFATAAIFLSSPFIILVLERLASSSSHPFIQFLPMAWPPIADKHKITFLFINFGATLILAFWALIPKNKILPNQPLIKILALAALLAYILIFQPYVWDNNRFILFPFLAMTILASIVLTKLFSSRVFLKKFLGGVLLILAIAQGVLATVHDPQIRYPLYSQEDFKLAEIIRKLTNPSDIFLTARPNNHPIPTLSGRKTVLGYSGYLWTQGIDEPKDITLQMNSVYQGEYNLQFFSANKVKYLVLGPWEKAEFLVNEPALFTRYPLIYDDGRVKIFKVDNSF